MAIERDMGAGGLPDIPMLPEDDMQIDLMELPDQPGVFEFDVLCL